MINLERVRTITIKIVFSKLLLTSSNVGVLSIEMEHLIGLHLPQQSPATCSLSKSLNRIKKKFNFIKSLKYFCHFLILRELSSSNTNGSF